MTEKHPILSANILEGISKILDGYTNSQIDQALRSVGIVIVDPIGTKWKRLFNAFANYQNTHKCCNAILNFCIKYFDPVRFVNGQNDSYTSQLTEFNRIMLFAGWQISKNGKLQRRRAAMTIAEVNERIKDFKAELNSRNAHSKIFYYCTPEIFSEDYFHLVEEAIKGLFDRIRELALLNSGDGQRLIDDVFSSSEPIIIINNFQTDSEKSEHKGFANMMKALYSMVRNPTAHSAKIKWSINKVDTLDILGTVSYCHRKLDQCHKIR